MISKKRRTHRKTGCVTCKVRKKRCSEDKPACSDCARLGFACVYLPDGCTRELATHYKEQVEADLRRRAAAERAGAAAAPAHDACDVTSSAADVTSAATGGPEGLHPHDAHCGGAAPAGAADGAYLDELLDELCALPSSPAAESASRALARSPSLHLSQPLHDPLVGRLDATALHLYNYYRDYLAQIISIAPVRQNYYLQIFLPMAHRHEGILYGLLAWSAHHLSIGPVRDDARHDADRWALEQALDESMRGGTPPLPPTRHAGGGVSGCAVVGDDDGHHDSAAAAAESEPDPSYAALANRYTLKSLQFLQADRAGAAAAAGGVDDDRDPDRDPDRDRDLDGGANSAPRANSAPAPPAPAPPYLWALAQILVLCGAEICQGDVARWKILLRCGANLIRDNAGNDISAVLQHGSFDSVTKQWLLANFIYHDVMGSETTHFPMWQYARVLQASDVDDSHVDPLHGVNRPVFQVLGEVMDVARRIKRKHVTRSHARFPALMARAQQLQAALYAVAPDARDLARYEDVHVSQDARQLCLTLFSVFRTTALVHLKTAVLRHAKDSYEVQFLVGQLSRELDEVLGSRLEGGLCFPLFICGVNSTEPLQRQDVERKFSDFIQRYKCRNVERARAVMRKVWRIDDDSSSLGSALRERDWFDVVDEMKWDISFA